MSDFFLYLTADNVDSLTGGGAVTHHELWAMTTLGGDTRFIQPSEVSIKSGNPFDQDASSRQSVEELINREGAPKIAHVYAGCFSETVTLLKSRGTKVTYTAAAHDVKKSKAEHQLLGLDYNYPHLTDPVSWQKYLAGYKEANVLVCPSKHSEAVMRGFGCQQKIVVIPHGVHVPVSVDHLPKRFTLGYLGSFGPDKGLRVLLEAWAKLSYKDATLVLAGRDSLTPWASALIQEFGGGNIHLAGWQENISTFFNSISAYCQPSITEGFGIEVLEAMAHGRVVICSTGAGAVDVIGVHGCSFHAGDVFELVGCIDQYKNNRSMFQKDSTAVREEAKLYSWDKIRGMYYNLWRGLLGYSTEVSDR